MDIQVPKVDGRTRTGGLVQHVIDRDTGQQIGTLEYGSGMELRNESPGPLRRKKPRRQGERVAVGLSGR
jgi:hypothetical protein